jgi:hypothetical protein
VQIQLSPAHPDFGKVGFAELEGRICKRAYRLWQHVQPSYMEVPWLVLGQIGLAPSQTGILSAGGR